MNYGRLFAAQATLSDFTKRFNANTASKEEKSAMITDVLGYLELDLAKVFEESIKKTKVRRNALSMLSSPSGNKHKP